MKSQVVSSRARNPGMSLLSRVRKGSSLILGFSLAMAAAQSQTYSVLHSFVDVWQGANPYAGLVLEGNTLYGTTGWGAGYGTVFKVNSEGGDFTILKIFPFSRLDGALPSARLVLDRGVLYGTTQQGGIWNDGTIFSLSTDGSNYVVLKHFPPIPGGTNGLPSDGANPNSGLVLDGNTLYGTAINGGITNPMNTNGFGTLFKINTDGSNYTVLKYFASTNADGTHPFGGLILEGNVLYGTAVSGGGANCGTVFKVNTDGTGFTVLKSFTGSDGASPEGDLLLSDGMLYGTTKYGGASNAGTIFKVSTQGEGFTVLKNFSQIGMIVDSNFMAFYTNSEGAWPEANLIAVGGALYGTTSTGGPPGQGTIFKVNTDGSAFRLLKTFPTVYPTSSVTGLPYTNTDGAISGGGLVLNGSALYGTTQNGGIGGWGVVFRLDLSTPLNLQTVDSQLVLSWTTNMDFSLQSAFDASGIFTNIPSATSPYTNPISATQQFFRLIAN